MNLAPLLEAPPAIVLHAGAAMAAFALGIVQFAAPKGTIPHRTMGWIWVGLMLAVARRVHQVARQRVTNQTEQRTRPAGSLPTRTPVRPRSALNPF